MSRRASTRHCDRQSGFGRVFLSRPTLQLAMGWHHSPPPLFISQLSVSWFEVGGPCRPLTQPSLRCAPLAVAPPRRRVRAIYPRSVPPEAESRRGCGAFCGLSCLRLSTVSAPGFHRRWPCCLQLALGPGSSPKAIQMPRMPANALRGLASPTPPRLQPPWPFAASAHGSGGGGGVVCCAAEFVRKPDASNQTPSVSTRCPLRSLLAPVGSCCLRLVSAGSGCGSGRLGPAWAG
jgi:hypothetical protein